MVSEMAGSWLTWQKHAKYGRGGLFACSLKAVQLRGDYIGRMTLAVTRLSFHPVFLSVTVLLHQ